MISLSNLKIIFMTWDIDVHTAGEYDVMIDYTCPLADAGGIAVHTRCFVE